MNFLSKLDLLSRFQNKSVAIVGSGPGSLQNSIGFVDAHDVVVRANNYKLSSNSGFRTDVHYSFYGSSIRKTVEELKRDGVTLCMCKCPNDQPIESEWHRKKDKLHGIDFRPIYRRRSDFWFCDTYIPSSADFVATFNLLGKHIPTTGFAAIIDIMSLKPSSIYLTGFDFFSSKIHNVNEPWRHKNPDDPIGHDPQREMAWLQAHKAQFLFDPALQRLLAARKAA